MKQILDTYLLNGLAQLVGTIVRPYGVQVYLYSDKLVLADYSLSIDEHAEAIRSNISGQWKVIVVKDKIIIK